MSASSLANVRLITRAKDHRHTPPFRHPSSQGEPNQRNQTPLWRGVAVRPGCVGSTPGSMRLDPVVDRLGHRVHAGSHRGILKPQKADSQCLKPALSHLVIDALQDVRFSIDLHRQHQIGREKIHDIFVNRLLPVEIKSPALATLQPLPEEDFRQRALVAQFASERFEPWVIGQSHIRIFQENPGRSRTHPALWAPLLIEGNNEIPCLSSPWPAAPCGPRA